VFPATAAALPARTHTLLYNDIMASEEEVRVPPLLKLAACALVGREAEVSKPGAVPIELREYQAAATATHCPRCAHRVAHNGGKDYLRCRFGHDTDVCDAQTTCRLARLGHTDCLLEAVRDALNNNRVELHIQPIVSLPQRRIRFFELLARPRDAEGQTYRAAECLDALDSAGLRAEFDALMLLRSVQLVRKLEQRAKDVGLVLRAAGGAELLKRAVAFARPVGMVGSEAGNVPQAFDQFSGRRCGLDFWHG